MFQPGQFCYIKNPQFHNPEDARPFSIASPPEETNYLEFCIKQYGEWTHQLAQTNVGDTLNISTPTGTFMWDESVKHAVFLIGGTGIAPIISILRHLEKQKSETRLTLIYGNRIPETSLYSDELERLEKTLKHFHVVHIYSHLPQDHSWPGYRGFINPDVINAEADLHQSPVFFLVGPPVFTQKVTEFLAKLNVSPTDIRQELLTTLPNGQALPSRDAHVG
jgi:ferredoxin-NADP reductase